MISNYHHSHVLLQLFYVSFSFLLHILSNTSCVNIALAPRTKLRSKLLHGIRSSWSCKQILWGLSWCLGHISRKSECLHCRFYSIFATGCARKMEKTRVLLTSFNYFEWKAEMVIQMRSKGLYRVTMGTDTNPNFVVEKDKYFNILDETFVMLCIDTSIDLTSM